MGVSKQQLLNTVKQLKDYIDYTAGPGEEFYTDFEINMGVDAILGSQGNGGNGNSNFNAFVFSVEDISEIDSNQYVSNYHRTSELQSITYENDAEISQLTNEREEF